jgi:hypothetical protein
MALPPKKPEIWKSVRYGAERSSGLLMPYSLPFQLEQKGCRLSELAEDILAKMETSHRISTVDLAVVTPQDLGIKGDATAEKIYAAALATGLALCKAEIAVYLRLQYLSQPDGEVLLVGMEPIKNSADYPRIFYLTTIAGVPWLRTRTGHAQRRWTDNSQWIFAL